MALPTNVNFGTVVGQFLLAYADGVDANQQPDGIPAKGSVFFRPSPVKLLDSSSTPNPVTILPAVVECLLDASGYLLGGDGTRGVRLVATNDPDLNPLNWTWTVEFRLTDQDDVPVPLPSFSITLPLNTTVDLTTASPVPDANGLFYLIGPTGPIGVTGATGPQGAAATVALGTTTTGAAGSSGLVTNSGNSGDAVFNFTVPRGNTGIQGVQGAAATVAAGTTTTGTAGTNASVTNSGTSAAAVFNFTVPRGNTGIQGVQGIQGIQGNAATIAVGTVSTGAPAAPVVVTNSGTANAAVFNFTIPKGDTGDLGALVGVSPITYSGTSIGLNLNALIIDGGTA